MGRERERERERITKGMKKLLKVKELEEMSQNTGGRKKRE